MPEAPVADVPGVELEAAVEADVVAAADLPKAGDAGRGHADDGQVVADLLFFTWQVWARADEAHLAFDDVEDLRQFVEAVLADELADLRDARVVAAEFLELLPLLLGLRVLAEEVQEDAVGVLIHRTELVALEGLAALADARGVVEGRAIGVEADHDGEHDEDGQDTDGDGGADDEVEGALEDLVAVALEVVARLEYEQPVVDAALDVDVADWHAEDVRDDRDVADEWLHAVENLDLLLLGEARRGQDDFLHGMGLQDLLGILETAEAWIFLEQWPRRIVFDEADDVVVHREGLDEFLGGLARADDDGCALPDVDAAQDGARDEALKADQCVAQNPVAEQEAARDHAAFAVDDVVEHDDGHNGVEGRLEDASGALAEDAARAVKAQRHHVQDVDARYDCVPGAADMERLPQDGLHDGDGQVDRAVTDEKVQDEQYDGCDVMVQAGSPVLCDG